MRRRVGKRENEYVSFHWRNFLMPFKDIKDITNKIMTRYSVTTKDNKRNGIELWQGKIGLNMRKNFLTTKVLNTEKGN